MKSIVYAPIALVLGSASIVNAWRREYVAIEPRRSLSSTSSCTGSNLQILHRLRGGDIIHAATLEDIETVLDGHPDKLVVIDFTSKNCPPCKKVAPLYEELSESEEFSEMVKFLKVDVDENPDAVAKYQVTGWPTFIFIKQGQVQTEIVGGKLAEATLYDWVKMLMPKDRAEQE